MTDRYAVMGQPVRHSLSPRIHTMFATACGQTIRYEALESDPEHFEAAVAAFIAAGGRGLNITAPFKVQAFALAQRASAHAQQAGATNALRVTDSGIEAENFDGVGLVRDITHNLGCPLRGRRVLVLGAGGATRGALQPLLGCDPAVVVVANRTAARAQALARAFDGLGRVEGIGLDALEPAAFDVVINATSASLQAEALVLPPGLMQGAALAYDMVYGRGLTPFLTQAGRDGVARQADGLGMLVEQAAEAFAWWRGVRPDTAAVIAALAVPLT